MALSTVWWLVTGGLIAVELLTGTFYLLMLSLGAAASALAAHSGLELTTQLVVGALVGGAAVTLWHLRSAQGRPLTDSAGNQDIHLDLGEQVEVSEWNSQGLAQVKHRGAQWTALLPPGQIPETGSHRIVEIVGSRLVLEKI